MERSVRCVDAETMKITPPQTCIEMNRSAPRPEPLSDERLAAMAKAMSNPNRVKIVRYLSQCRPLIENDVVEATGLAQATISEHVRTLTDAGVVTIVDDPPRKWYCVNRAAIASLAAALTDLPTPFSDADQAQAPESCT
jgi:ArsR family transcriptional regulator